MSCGGRGDPRSGEVVGLGRLNPLHGVGPREGVKRETQEEAWLVGVSMRRQGSEGSEGGLKEPGEALRGATPGGAEQEGIGDRT